MRKPFNIQTDVFTWWYRARDGTLERSTFPQ